MLLPTYGYVGLNIGGDELQKLYIARHTEHQALIEHTLCKLFYHLHHTYTRYYRMAGKVPAEDIMVSIEHYPATVLVVGLLYVVGCIKIVVEQVSKNKLLNTHKTPATMQWQPV